MGHKQGRTSPAERPRLALFIITIVITIILIMVNTIIITIIMIIITIIGIMIIIVGHRWFRSKVLGLGA